jgi:hypothetical protein
LLELSTTSTSSRSTLDLLIPVLSFVALSKLKFRSSDADSTVAKLGNLIKKGDRLVVFSRAVLPAVPSSLKPAAKMKSPGTTTQAKNTPGSAVQRHASFNTSVISTPRTSSPHHEVTQEHISPPTYSSPGVPPLEEKDSANDATRQFIRHHSNPILETGSLSNRNYSPIPQSLPETFNRPLEESVCNLLPNRPAVWIVKGKGLKISSLAGSILLDDGILTSKDLTL